MCTVAETLAQCAYKSQDPGNLCANAALNPLVFDYSEKRWCSHCLAESNSPNIIGTDFARLPLGCSANRTDNQTRGRDTITTVQS